MLNKVILIGNLGKDPEIRYTTSGAAVANFSMATTEKFKNKEGEKQEVVTWHNIIVWRQLAEICGKYLTKGKQIYIEGKIQVRSYDGKDGEKRYVTEIVADQMKMLGSAGDGQRSEGRAASTPPRQSQRPASDDFDDPPFDPDQDIPF